MLLCNFCSKECKHSNSLKNHVIRCKLNPDKIHSVFRDKEHHVNLTNRSNQYIKARRLGLPDPIVSDEAKLKMSLKTINWDKENPGSRKEIGKRVSRTIAEKVNNGTWHTSLAKHMHIDYNGINMHGSWEVAYAKYLDENKIIWIRNKDQFSYFYNGKNRKYTPDFYLPDENVYIEIKGYKTEKDSAKWDQFPKDKTLRIIMEKELKELKLI